MAWWSSFTAPLLWTQRSSSGQAPRGPRERPPRRRLARCAQAAACGPCPHLRRACGRSRCSSMWACLSSRPRLMLQRGSRPLGRPGSRRWSLTTQHSSRQPTRPRRRPRLRGCGPCPTPTRQSLLCTCNESVCRAWLGKRGGWACSLVRGQACCALLHGWCCGSQGLGRGWVGAPPSLYAVHALVITALYGLHLHGLRCSAVWLDWTIAIAYAIFIV
mmetsp:Transcript_31211/g.79575  ORF Transcript_31211/g.79575 Transcript_31211/m.79575 type:complete len:217 (+) Transcript_31211:659-1309(+)